MKYQLDAKGLACPLPVVKTKKAMEKLSQDDILEVFVDNEIAVENLLKFAKVKGYQAEAYSVDGQNFKVGLSKGKVIELMEESIQKEDLLVVISSNTMGQGDEKLGKALMKAFIFALTKQDILPSTLLFYNSGAYLTSEGSECLEDLNYLTSCGVDIQTCGTCMDFYGLKDKLQVGTVTNMYAIVEMMESARRIIKP